MENMKHYLFPMSLELVLMNNEKFLIYTNIKNTSNWSLGIVVPMNQMNEKSTSLIIIIIITFIIIITIIALVAFFSS
jgi:hypothetical protein